MKNISPQLSQAKRSHISDSEFRALLLDVVRNLPSLRFDWEIEEAWASIFECESILAIVRCSSNIAFLLVDQKHTYSVAQYLRVQGYQVIFATTWDEPEFTLDLSVATHLSDWIWRVDPDSSLSDLLQSFSLSEMWWSTI